MDATQPRMWFELPEQSQIILNEDSDPALPSHRWKHGAVVCGNAVYMYGGRDSHRSLGDLWKFDLDVVMWEEIQFSKSDRPPSLQEHSMNAWNNSLYIFGGETLTFGPGNLWIFSVKKRRWRCIEPSSKSICPASRRGHSAVVHDNFLFIYGGYQDLRGSVGDLWAFDLQNEVWTPVNGLGDVPLFRHCHVAVASENAMFIHGGMSNLQELGDLWKWDFHSKRWTQLYHRGGPRFLHSHAATLVDEYLFIFGGIRDGHVAEESWKFQLNTLTWEKVLSPLDTPSARALSSLLEIPTQHVPSILEALHSPSVFFQVPLVQLSRSRPLPETDDISRSMDFRSFSSISSVLSSRLGLRTYNQIRPDFGIEMRTYRKVPTRSDGDDETELGSFIEPDFQVCTSECVETPSVIGEAFELKCFILCGGLETVKPTLRKTPLSFPKPPNRFCGSIETNPRERITRIKTGLVQVYQHASKISTVSTVSRKAVVSGRKEPRRKPNESTPGLDEHGYDFLTIDRGEGAIDFLR